MLQISLPPEYSRPETIRLVAEDLRAARARLGITSGQAARRAGVAAARYRGLEKGRVPSSQHILRKLVSVCRRLDMKSVRVAYVEKIGQYVNIDLSRDARREPLTAFLDVLEAGVAELPAVLSSSVGAWQTWPMKRDTLSYHGYRFPPDIISHAVWLYHRFGVSFRDVEDLLAQRGITVSYEAIRLWCLTFGSVYARRLKRRQGRLGDIWHLDEVFVTIQGQRRYLWRAVDQDGDVIDILVQSRRDCRAATRFFRKLLKGQERTPGRLVTDKLSSYRAAHRAVMPSVAHRTDRYENNRAEVSHQPTRQRERQMRRFKSPGQAQRFLSVHGLVRNLFRVGRYLVRAVHHRELRGRSFLIWDAVTIAA